MTSLAVEWATLPTPAFVAWARRPRVRLPFPRNTGAQPSGCSGEAVLVLLDATSVALRQIWEADLAASIVGSMPRLPMLAVPTVDVSLRGLQEVDAAIAAGAWPRTVRLQLPQLGLPEQARRAPGLDDHPGQRDQDRRDRSGLDGTAPAATINSASCQTGASTDPSPQAIRWAVGNGATVLNLSYVTDFAGEADAVRYPESKDVVVVAARETWGASASGTGWGRRPRCRAYLRSPAWMRT